MLVKSCLLYHPDTADDRIKNLHIGVKALYQDRSLKLHFDVLGDIDYLLIPKPKSPEEVDGLWQHTCFEAFISVVEESYYREFNFSPSGDWAAYAFDDYRHGKTWRARTPPVISYVRTSDRFSLEAVLSQDDLPENPRKQPYRLGLTAVLEVKTGGLSYWALFHPAGKPDFHHRAGFTLSF
ncbi:MAG: DOMON-like domain-containing protein [Gammaproteobacteria bacterium]|nr:DOMON-like domain-containing protein [Gammaproteobacteria bacterium]